MEKKVTVINPTVKQDTPKQQLKVAAYCKVSTDHEDQASSLKAQVTHFINIICENSN